jgi:ubiquinone/menaquinone biosynthesis C-methylase UbiE
MAEYDDIASSYNELHGSEQAMKAMIIATHLHTTASDDILDVGCGTGLGSQFLKGNKTGIEPSEGLAKQCPFKTLIGKAEELPFKDKSFDVTVCVSAVHNFDDVEKGLSEIARVTKRDVAITVLKRSKKAATTDKLLRKIFDIKEVIEQANDKIYIGRVRQ